MIHLLLSFFLANALSTALPQADPSCIFGILGVDGNQHDPARFIWNTQQSTYVRCSNVDTPTGFWGIFQVWGDGDYYDLAHDPNDVSEDSPFNTNIPLDPKTKTAEFFFALRTYHDLTKNVAVSHNYTVAIAKSLITPKEVNVNLLSDVVQDDDDFKKDIATYGTSGPEVDQYIRVVSGWDHETKPGYTHGANNVSIFSEFYFRPILEWYSWEVENPEFPGTRQLVGTRTV